MVVQDGKFIHKHYAKLMASLEVTLSRTAMSESSKLNIFTQESCRCLRNCSTNIPWEEKVTYLNQLMLSMMWANYSTKQRNILAWRVLAKHHNDLANHQLNGRSLYRSKELRQERVKPDKAKWIPLWPRH